MARAAAIMGQMRTVGLMLATLALTSAYGQRLPSSVTAETGTLQFHVATPRARSSLDAELREAIAEVRKQSGRARLVKLRVFVAHGEDAAHVLASIPTVLEKFVKNLMPVVSVVQIGGLENGARVLVEAIAETKANVNPGGLAFISGQLTQSARQQGRLLDAVAPLAEKSIASIRMALKTNAMDDSDVRRVTCFTSTLGDAAQVRALVSGAFPNAVLAMVQLERDAMNNEVECESVARLKQRPAEPVQLINPTGAQFALMALVAAPQVVFTRVEAGALDDAAVRQMFTSLKTTLAAGGSSTERVFYMHAYPGSPAALQKFREIRWEFFDKKRAPASTNLVFEGVPPAGSGVGVEVIALRSNGEVNKF